MRHFRTTADNSPGTYALVFACHNSFQTHVGKLGDIHVSTGYWIYVGSAFGPGGLRSRLRHHLKPSRRPHWHLDYIKTGLQVVDVWTTADTVKREHDWAGLLVALKGASSPIGGFGASDCNCPAHLFHLPQRPRFAGFVRRVHCAIAGHGRVSAIDPDVLLIDRRPGFGTPATLPVMGV